MSGNEFVVFIDEITQNFVFGDCFSGSYTKNVVTSGGQTRTITLTPMLREGRPVVQLNDNGHISYMGTASTTTNGNLMVQIREVPEALRGKLPKQGGGIEQFSRSSLAKETVSIRNAAESDLNTLVALNAQVQSLHAQNYPADFKLLTDDDEVREFFGSVLRQAAHAILLAQVEGADVGYAWIEIMDRPPTPFTLAKKRVFLHHICVESGYRRLGVGFALMTRIEELAATAGVDEFVLDMWSSNESAQEFFASCGLEAFRLFLRKPVGGPKQSIP